MVIGGAGLSGMIAAQVFPDIPIIEQRTEPQAHAGVLRFRSGIVSDLTGIPFRKVQVRKAIYQDDGLFDTCDARMANLYSYKVAGAITPRSIWDLSPCYRYVAPPGFYALLCERNAHRIRWGANVFNMQGPIISTVPLPHALHRFVPESDRSVFLSASIWTATYSIPNCDVHQTIYFPDDDTCVYRASITGDELIIEASNPIVINDVMHVLHAFGINWAGTVFVSESTRNYGKIVPIDNALRREFIRELTEAHGVYSLGRFATWKNILLDDVVTNARKVQSMIAMRKVTK